MGCGCGGGKRNTNSSRRVVANAPQRIVRNNNLTARQVPVQTQSNQIQALSANVRSQLQQQNGPNTETEKKRRIQISLRNRNKKS